MHLAYTDAQESLRSELRAYYDRILDPETRQAIHDEPTGSVMRSVVKQMAADGWLGIGWPVEYGGQGKGPMEQFIFFDESMRAGAPVIQGERMRASQAMAVAREDATSLQP